MGLLSRLLPTMLAAAVILMHQQKSLESIILTSDETARKQENSHMKPHRPPSLADGCYHVFVDAGSNRGVHGRFLFEPEKYNRSLFIKKFDEMFGNNRTKQNICVFAFEPNVQKHNASQMATQEAYHRLGWRYHYIPYGVSDKDGQVTFFRNWDYFNGLRREEWGFGTHLHSTKMNASDAVMNSSLVAIVETIDLATWSERHIFNRTIPFKNEYNRHHPVVAMKIDVEGSEYRTIDHMIESGTACKFDYILGELHFTDVPQAFGKHNLTTEHHAERYAKYMKKALAKEGCPKFLEFDDEKYLHDGQPYPVPGERWA
jgi:FkbM family methyltransferase